MSSHNFVMKKEDSKILDKLGKDPGFTVPENYFANFASGLMDSLPEVKISEEEKPTLWVRIRPFVYMAAMFAGIWLMMNIFTVGKKSSADMRQMSSQLSNSLPAINIVEDFMDYEGYSEYDLLYEDSLYIESENVKAK